MYYSLLAILVLGRFMKHMEKFKVSNFQMFLECSTTTTKTNNVAVAERCDRAAESSVILHPKGHWFKVGWLCLKYTNTTLLSSIIFQRGAAWWCSG